MSWTRRHSRLTRRRPSEAQKEFESTMAELEKAAAPAAAPAESPAQVNIATHVRTPGLQAQMAALRAAAKKLI
jgi:hypothetical protein